MFPSPGIIDPGLACIAGASIYAVRARLLKDARGEIAVHTENWAGASCVRAAAANVQTAGAVKGGSTGSGPTSDSRFCRLASLPESCPWLWAVEARVQRAAYERFGLNDRQIELVSRATPKRQYYLQSARGNRLFELGLGPIALALCGASDPDAQKRIDAILSEIDPLGVGLGDPLEFARRFLAGAGLEWAADLLVRFPDPPTPEGENP